DRLRRRAGQRRDNDPEREGSEGRGGEMRAFKLCGCVLSCMGDNLHEPRVTFCPTHAAAPEMRQFVADVARWLGEVSGPDAISPGNLADVRRDARALLARIQGEVEVEAK